MLELNINNLPFLFFLVNMLAYLQWNPVYTTWQRSNLTNFTKKQTTNKQTKQAIIHNTKWNKSIIDCAHLLLPNTFSHIILSMLSLYVNSKIWNHLLLITCYLAAFKYPFDIFPSNLHNCLSCNIPWQQILRSK